MSKPLPYCKRCQANNGKRCGICASVEYDGGVPARAPARAPARVFCAFEDCDREPDSSGFCEHHRAESLKVTP